MAKDENPALIYRDIARKIAAKVKENVGSTIEHGKSPDLHWKLEQAIVDALRYADQQGAERMRAQYENIMKDFDDKDGTSTS